MGHLVSASSVHALANCTFTLYGVIILPAYKLSEFIDAFVAFVVYDVCMLIVTVLVYCWTA